jgi:hypothetical protein
VLDYLRDASATTSAVNPPNMLIVQGVSLPWESGLAATLLLPSAGETIVRDGKVWPFGVPFDAAAGDIPDGQSVDVRYDPMDARYVYLVYKSAHVRRVSASAFEHRVAWAELVDDPAMLMEKAI